MNELFDRIMDMPPRQRALFLVGGVGAIFFLYAYFVYWPRSEAIATRQETRVMLDLEQRAFRIERDVVVHTLPRNIEVKLFTAQSDLVNERVGAIRFFPDGGSNGGRVTLASGTRKYDIDIDWLTGRVAILD